MIKRVTERRSLFGKSKTPALLILMTFFIISGCVALVRGVLAAAVYCGGFALISLYGAIPRRPRDGGLQLREVVVLAVLVDVFAGWLVVDLLRAAGGAKPFTWRVWLDLPMLAITVLFGYAATAGALRLYRGDFIADTRHRP
jgi:hypothetical protein